MPTTTTRRSRPGRRFSRASGGDGRGGFLAGYGGHPRMSYATDLRLFANWCHDANLTLFDVRRAHLEGEPKPVPSVLVPARCVGKL